MPNVFISLRPGVMRAVNLQYQSLADQDIDAVTFDPCLGHDCNPQPSQPAHHDGLQPRIRKWGRHLKQSPCSCTYRQLQQTGPGYETLIQR